MEILNLAVEPGGRRRGAGSSLLKEALRWGRARRAGKAHLEVRASNLAALKFYEHNGFASAGRRPRYYSAPIEDALLLSAPLTVA
jgi:ribosomal-protein-alanine N-acetyltransferase